MVEKALSETKISAVSFGRPLVREPNLPNRWKKTDVLQCVFLAIVAVILWGTKLLLVKLRNKAKYRDEQFSSLPSEMQAGNKARTGRKSVVGIFPV